jgi:hypothetical protein
MGIESLTYAELGDRFGASPEAARSLARRLRLPRRPGNDGKVRITVDLAEIQYKPLPARSPNERRADGDGLRIEQLQSELARLEVEKRCLEASAASHRADFEHERERCDGLMSEALKLSAVAMSAREKVARLEALLEARRVGHWWRRLLARDAVQTRASRGGNGRSAVLAGVPVRI